MTAGQASGATASAQDIRDMGSSGHAEGHSGIGTFGKADSCLPVIRPAHDRFSLEMTCKRWQGRLG
jgi:hypothetical protein